MFTRNDECKAKDLGGGVTRRILSYDGKMMACELTFEKGAVGALHSHPHEQIGYLISGSLELQEGPNGEKKTVLMAGDSYYAAPNEVHGVLALEETKLLDVFTPIREDFLD